MDCFVFISAYVCERVLLQEEREGEKFMEPDMQQGQKVSFILGKVSLCGFVFTGGSNE